MLEYICKLIQFVNKKLSVKNFKMRQTRYNQRKDQEIGADTYSPILKIKQLGTANKTVYHKSEIKLTLH